AARVALHLGECPACRADAAMLSEVVGTLSDSVPPRDPPAALRARILATAGAERVERVERTGFRIPFLLGARLTRVTVGGLAAAGLALVVLNVGELGMLRTAQTERAQAESIAERFIGSSGRSWYMSGVGDWRGSGGTLFARQDAAPFVLFHDLKA